MYHSTDVIQYTMCRCVLALPARSSHPSRSVFAPLAGPSLCLTSEWGVISAPGTRWASCFDHSPPVPVLPPPPLTKQSGVPARRV